MSKQTKSHRAKQNMTKQLQGRLSWLKSDLRTEERGMAQAKVFCKRLGKPFAQSTSYKAYTQGIAATKRQIAALTRLIRKRQANGEIYKII